MKVVFLKDVPNVAHTGETKEVASGYARNYLIPKGIAVIANAQAMDLVEAKRRAKARQQAETEAELKTLAQELESREITLEARVGAQEQLYGSITNADIAVELESGAGIVVDKRKIELAEPIRQLGSYEITVKLAKDITPTIKVTVTGKTEEESK